MKKMKPEAIRKEIIQLSEPILKTVQALSCSFMAGNNVTDVLSEALNRMNQSLRVVREFEEGQIYKYYRYNEEEHAYLRFEGFFDDCGELRAKFRLIASTVEKINYELVIDDHFRILHNISVNEYHETEIDPKDLAKLAAYEFKGPLFEDMVKKGKVK